jgi:hypothetical protein
MTTLAKLLSQKQELIERLQQEDIGPEERDEIGRLLNRINAALDALDEAGPMKKTEPRRPRFTPCTQSNIAHLDRHAVNIGDTNSQ